MNILARLDDDARRQALDDKRDALLAEARRELAPGEIRPRWAQAIMDGPRPDRTARFGGGNENG